ncbi:hypothetical protein P43SY_010376 [Pythium insidiosum]|uniref:CAP-Gly domain-containing protein n=1 Tax=Pythium insidiosum TaxID=114742 RepID=A0AAD5Q1V9_PYTIN|nr:hypothetical protein P43SY_010376 [Pythium insidiosum]
MGRGRSGEFGSFMDQDMLLFEQFMAMSMDDDDLNQMESDLMEDMMQFFMGDPELARHNRRGHGKGKTKVVHTQSDSDVDEVEEVSDWEDEADGQQHETPDSNVTATADQPKLEIDAKARVFGTHSGVIKFIGPVHYSSGDFVGVALDEPVGKNDGTVKGVTYFSCPPSHGIMVRPTDVQTIPSRHFLNCGAPAKSFRWTGTRNTMRVCAVLASLAGVGLLASQQADADSIYGNPLTGGSEKLIPLTKTHPARGSAVPPDSIALQVTVPAVDNKRRGLRNKEDREADSTVVVDDITRLEAHFKTKMVRSLKELEKHPSSEFTPAPWPASYWPIFQDGINFPWNYENDKQSPAEKYARAYGHEPKKFMDKISEVNGILSQKERRACSTDQECESLKDGSACGKRIGEAKGHCIPRWFGICHAWAPAAIEEREPSCAVTKNNVTFQPVDIKALMTQAYDGSHLATVFTGARFNGPDEPANKDKDGRYVDPARRDLGPGFFHIAVHNIMGIHKKSCVVDVSSGAEVWNQPVRSYQVVKLEEMSPSDGAQRFFQKPVYTFNEQAKKVAYVQLTLRWVVEGVENGPLVSTGIVDRYTHSATYEYLLELDAQSNIIGGEWVNESREKHPDFLWFPAGRPSMNTVTDLGLSYKDIRELLDASADCKELDKPSTPAPTTATPTTTAPAPTTTAPAPTPQTATPSTVTPAPGTSTPAPATTAPSGNATPSPTSGVPSPSSGGNQTPVPTTAIPATNAPTKRPDRPGQNDDDSDDSDDDGSNEDGESDKPTRTPGNGKPYPTPAGGKGHNTPAPTPAGGKGQYTPAPTSSGDNGKQPPAPTPAGGKGQYTPAPTSSGDNGKQPPAPTPAGGKGQYTPAPTSSGDNGKQPPAPTPAGGKGQYTPAPTAHVVG